MRHFTRLLQLLQQEILYQEKLLEVLGHERAAIVHLHQEDIERLAARKAEVIEQARALETERREVLRELSGGGTDVKFSEIVALCPSADVRQSLEQVGGDLKETALAVKDLNETNAQLLRQAFSLVASTLAIFRSEPGTELPTYAENGSIKSAPDPAFTKRRSGVTRQA